MNTNPQWVVTPRKKVKMRRRLEIDVTASRLGRSASYCGPVAGFWWQSKQTLGYISTSKTSWNPHRLSAAQESSSTVSATCVHLYRCRLLNILCAQAATSLTHLCSVWSTNLPENLKDINLLTGSWGSHRGFYNIVVFLHMILLNLLYRHQRFIRNCFLSLQAGRLFYFENDGSR